MRPDQKKLCVCVFRHMIPNKREWKQTSAAAKDNALLSMFLDDYFNNTSYFDWGDDPGFYSAQALIGSSAAASWSVCRADVRRSLRVGDSVAYFLIRAHFKIQDDFPKSIGTADYFYIGCGTVSELPSRREIWSRSDLEPYRRFLNVLVRPENGHLVNIESFRPIHDDWKHRADSPVVLFSQEHSHFELDRPHQVARYDRAQGFRERWLPDSKSQRLATLLFGSTDRRLRTSPTGYQHAKLVLRKPAAEMAALTRELRQLAMPQS